MSTSSRILEARARAGLSQSQLAARAGVPQPNLSAYEAGRVQPRPGTLSRILAATAERPAAVLRRNRDSVLELAGRRRAGNVRVFGSIARDTEAVRSDIDLLVTFDPAASLLDAAGLVLDLESLLGVHICDERPGRRRHSGPGGRRGRSAVRYSGHGMTREFDLTDALLAGSSRTTTRTPTIRSSGMP
ncbi:helix-turn-helix domain-containing protein [Cryobacterium sp. TmT2-59]|uniref:helix-turn-helix domain-containing protein n=1 Tax=Cryobacterium sp. TmT2-59 TaxID=1259264 RepID=UPI00106D5EE0|nr:helix-turn-helix domain-containing protein [Cryobacterium sp. TmT2-59]TFC81102.1 helix-turn-helix domain-containing protein [Cryobacterium sp. TmT2-59]